MIAPVSSVRPSSVSVVVVTYHTGDVLFSMLASVLAQPEAGELILVNNGNPPEILKRLQDMAAAEPRLKIVTGHGNIGFASAVNKGAKESSGDYLFILNPDCVLPEGFLAACLSESARLPRPHLISARILDETGKEQSGSRRNHLTPWQALSEIFSVYRMFPDIPQLKRFNLHNDPVPTETVRMPAISGAVIFIPKEDFWRVDGLDGDYFLHVDDLDFCLRFERAGGGIYFMPAPAVTHIGGTSDTPKLQVEYWKTQSFGRFFFKNYSKDYPRLLLWLVTAAAWARFGLFALKTYLQRVKALLIKRAA